MGRATLTKGPDRARLMMHPDDAASRGLSDGAMALVRSRTGEVRVAVELTASVMPGVVSLPHGYGHQRASRTLRAASQLAGPSANALTDELHVEPLIGTSVLNGVSVEVVASSLDVVRDAGPG